jgi:hypothetical protein
MTVPGIGNNVLNTRIKDIGTQFPSAEGGQGTDQAAGDGDALMRDEASDSGTEQDMDDAEAKQQKVVSLLRL